MTKTIKIGDREYQVRKLPAYPDQMLLMKATMPVYNDIMPVIVKIIKERAGTPQAKTITPDQLIEVLDAVFMGLQKLSDDDLLRLTERSLTAVQVRQGNAAWSNIMLPSGQLMFQNIELSEILTLIWNVVEVNLSGFFVEHLGKSQGGKAA